RPEDPDEDVESAAPEDDTDSTDTALRRPPRSRRPDTKVIVRIDYAALKRGLAEAGETCDIAGVGPVSVATVEELLGDAFGAAIVTNGVDVFTVAHLGRSVTEHQRSALEARGYCCEVPGCGATTALEIDHIEDWAKAFRTEVALLAWLCRRHHRDKTHKGWRLLGSPGNRRWVLPEEAASRSDGTGREPPGTAADGERPRLFGDPTAA
ncbi:MAG TPA: HNH endonuclease signature motif containing protein, partial [Acidimicrobiales bacterium]|nr:HNH endonuclease signature motif containing protein [Acidimicrobiales bacterium]